MDQVSVQWFPGHMAKTRRLIQENLYLVDIVIEIRDARIPQSSRNPDLGNIIGKKPRLVLLNKCDLADSDATAKWLAFLKSIGITALAVDCKSGKGISRVVPTVRELLAEELKKRAEKGMSGKPLRMMAVGIPNSGKSSFINRMAGSRRTKVEDRPGVTRGKQWVNLESGIALLDMPGVLMPKFEDKNIGELLAFTGAVKDDIIDTQALAMRLVSLLSQNYPLLLSERYGFSNESSGLDEEGIINLIAKKRGMLLPGGIPDFERASIMLLDEFRGGKLGKITLELPEISGGNRSK